MADKTHRVEAKDRERIGCMKCDSPADICEHSGGGFYYFCDPCFAEQTHKREQREAYHRESKRANAELRILNALQVVKDAILTADADGLPAWEHFRELRSELARAGIIA